MDELMPALSRKSLLAGVIFSLCLTLVVTTSLPLIARALHLGNEIVYWVSRTSFWVTLGLLFLYAKHVEKQPLLFWGETSRPIEFYFLWAVALIFIIYGGSIIMAIILKLTHLDQASKRMAQIIDIFRHDVPLMLFTCITAGITEEFFFRGYMQPRLQLIFKNAYAAIFVSSLLFALLHAGYGTVAQVAGPLFIGSVFAVHYYKFKNIKVLMICHFLWDLQAMLINLFLIKHH